MMSGLVKSRPPNCCCGGSLGVLAAMCWERGEGKDLWHRGIPSTASRISPKNGSIVIRFLSSTKI